MPPQNKNPYKGPAFFTSDDEGIFHGRKQETRDLVSIVATERVVFFYAPSGAGKTSLLNAGLIPQLRRKRYEVLPRSRVIGAPTVLPEVRNVFVYNAMLHLAEGEEQPEQFYDLTLSDFLWHLSTKDGKRYFYDPGAEALRLATPREKLWPRVLVLDQFEELVTHYPTYWRHRNDFFHQLDAALESDPMLRVVLSLRSDYVQALDRWTGLLQGGLAGRYHMLLLSKSGGLDAVTKPAEDPGGRPYATNPETGESVAQALIDNLSQIREQDESGTLMVEDGEWVEPIQLQVVCEQLWDSLPPGDCITIDDLKALARRSTDLAEESDEDTMLAAFVDGALTTFYETKLRQALDKAPATVDQEEMESDLRRLFSNRLITPAGTRGLVQKGSDATDHIPDSVIAALVDSHLLRSDRRGSIELLELIHDRFVEPIRQSNQRFDELRMAAFPWIADARKWYASGSTPETRTGALPEGEALAKILIQAEGKHFEPAVEEYLEAIGEEKRKRELVQANERADQEARQGKRLLRMAVALTVMTLLTGIATVRFLITARAERVQRTRAETSQLWSSSESALARIAEATAVAAEGEAESLRLIEQSQILADQSRRPTAIEDRLLLARRAVRAWSSLPAEVALLDALQQAYSREGAPAPYQPFERLHFAGVGPWHRVAFNKDGSILAFFDDEGGIRLWDNKTKEPIGERLDAHEAYFNANYSMDFDPVHARLASASGDRDDPTSPKNDLVLWQLDEADGPKKVVMAANQPSMWSVDFSPDGQQLAVGNQDGTVTLWDLSASTAMSRTLPGRHADWAFSVAFDPKGNRLASAGKDNAIILWSDLAARQPVSRTLSGHSAWVNDVVFSPDGASLASGSDDGTVRLWNLDEDRPTSRIVDNQRDSGSEAWELAFSPDDGKRLAVGWGDGQVRVYDMSDLDAEPLALAGHSGEAWSVAFDPTDPERLISVSNIDNEPFSWDLGQRSDFATVQPVSLPISPVETGLLTRLDANGKWLASVDPDQGIAAVAPMDVSGQPVTFTIPFTATAIALSADGGQLAIGGCAPGKKEAPAATAAAAAIGQAAYRQTVAESTATALAQAQGAAACQVDVWSVNPAAKPERNQTLTFGEPIQALAFYPDRADLVVGLASGNVEAYDLERKGEPEILMEGAEAVPEISDFAFSRDGSLLAILSGEGQVELLNWEKRDIIDQGDVKDSDAGRFNAITFLKDDSLLAIASDVPEVGLWALPAWKKVTALPLGSKPAFDLTYDAEQQDLVSIRTDDLIRLPMDEQAWLELACVRAQRNLSYQAWRDAFADETGYENALICPELPLDKSFADARVDEATNLIEECQSEDVEQGLKLLDEAKNMKVEPPLPLQPLDKALAVLNDQALKKLRQASAVHNAQARQCLQVAAGLVASDPQRAFDPVKALEIGQQLVRAEEAIASRQHLQLQEAARELGLISKDQSPWPLTLLSAPNMLTETYFLLCRQGDAMGCRGLEASPEFMTYGKTVSQLYEPEQEQARFFKGGLGDLVEITVDTKKENFISSLRLEAPNGSEYPGGNLRPDYEDSFVELMLPAAGYYRIIPGAQGEGEGTYQLTLKGATALGLGFGQSVASNTQEHPIWWFEGKQSQPISVSLEAAAAFDPYLALQQADGSTLAENTASSTTTAGAAQITPFILPADGRYFLRAIQPGASTGTNPYTLTLSALTPSELVVDALVSSTTLDNPLWKYEGRAGQILDIALSTTDPILNPYLTLRRSDGTVVTEDDDSGGELNARIQGAVLLADGPYFVQVGQPGIDAIYELRLTEVLPSPAALGQDVTATSESQRFWEFGGRAGQFIDVGVFTTDPDFNPHITLRRRDGSVIAEGIDSDDTMSASIQGAALPADETYIIQIDPPDSASPYDLLVTEASPLPIAPGEDIVSSSDSNRLWEFSAEAGQTIRVDMTSGDFDTLLEVYDATGIQVAKNDDYFGSNSSRAEFVPVSDGPYVIVARPYDNSSSGEYSLSVAALASKPVVLDQPTDGSFADTMAWTTRGRQGDLLRIALDPTNDPSILPSLRLVGPSGEVVRADNSGQDRILIPLAVLPADGVYSIIPSTQQSTGGYRLRLFKPEARSIGLNETVEEDLGDGVIWDLRDVAEKSVSIRLEDGGDGIDPFLTVMGENGAVLAENDDGGGGYNSLVTLPNAPQRLIILPKAYGGRTSGRYRLIVTAGPTP